MATAYEQMYDTICERDMLPNKAGILLMVSGGSDSTALAYLMKRFQAENPSVISAVAMLHFNHKLRGQNSDDDAAFVESLASALDIPLFMVEMDIQKEASRSGANIEAVARTERYLAANEALASMCQHEGITPENARIVVAHTADDRIENFYMRSIVGTGPGGFRSMRYVRDNIVRPLLDCSRAQLQDYIMSLAKHESSNIECSCTTGGTASRGSVFSNTAIRDDSGAFWREDETNAHTDRFRAYVRHEIVPKAKQWNAALDETLTRTLNLIADEDDMLLDMTQVILRNKVESIAGESFSNGAILHPEFGDEPAPLQRRCILAILKDMIGHSERIDFKSIEAVLESFENNSPKSGYVTNVQGDIVVSSNKRGVRIEPMSAYRARRKML